MANMPKNLKQPLLEHFGAAQGEQLWQAASDIYYPKLLPMAASETPDRRKTLENSIYPIAAIYRAVLASGLSREEAMEQMASFMELRTRSGPRQMYERLGKLPFFFPLFRRMFSRGLQGDNWTVEWVSNDSERFEYNITRCLWHDACTALGHPELCRIFCRNDEINFTDVSPRLHFRRKNALGYGGPCCDFHFYRHPPREP